jgi:uncharacterized protein YdhG (YjbR/CyaY superfamily)
VTAPTVVEEYLVALPEAQRGALQQLRATIQAAAPEAAEVFAYKMPGFKHHGPLLYYAAWAKHLALYGVSDAIVSRYSEELAPFRGKDSTLRFTPENPIPGPLVTKLVKARVAENEAGRNVSQGRTA